MTNVFSILKGFLKRTRDPQRAEASPPPEPAAGESTGIPPALPPGKPPADRRRTDPAPGGTSPPNPPEQGGTPRPVVRTRLGIRRLPDGEDFHRLFGVEKAAAKAERPPPGEGETKPPAPRDPEPTPARKSVIRRNRHGIPVLDDESDWYGLFELEVPGPGEGDPAAEANTAADRRIPERRPAGRPAGRRKTPVHQRIRDYPAVQGQLDLHGYTAADAARRAESYLLNARHAGQLTLRIIVGRGLHSSGGAVLPGVVEEVVLDLKRRGVVLTYRWEKRRRADSGSVTVFIDPPG